MQGQAGRSPRRPKASDPVQGSPSTALLGKAPGRDRHGAQRLWGVVYPWAPSLSRAGLSYLTLGL